MGTAAVRTDDSWPGGLTQGTPVGVVGASTRAAAMSLVRAGLRPWAVDLFADRDLRRIARVERCSLGSYSSALPSLCDSFPPGPVMYTGGLENAPEVVAGLAHRRPLWGNGADVLQQIRDPFRLHSVLAAYCPVASLVPVDAPVPAHHRWLRKPLKGSGGLSICFAKPGECVPRTHYAQEYMEGPVLSAQFISDDSDTMLLGVTEQLVGERWLHASPFGYSGNLGPLVIPDQLSASLRRLGALLTQSFRLLGIWGLDFILRDNTAIPIEVNPRYTAAIELFELSVRCGLLMKHSICFPTETQDRRSTLIHKPVQNVASTERRLGAHMEGRGSCRAAPLSRSAGASPSRTSDDRVWDKTARRDSGIHLDHTILGKAVYFAPCRIVFPAYGPWDEEFAGDFDPWRLPTFADIPDPCTVIETGAPVLTFFTTGSTTTDCRAKLIQQAAELDRLFQ